MLFYCFFFSVLSPRVTTQILFSELTGQRSIKERWGCGVLVVVVWSASGWWRAMVILRTGLMFGHLFFLNTFWVKHFSGDFQLIISKPDDPSCCSVASNLSHSHRECASVSKVLERKATERRCESWAVVASPSMTAVMTVKRWKMI